MSLIRPIRPITLAILLALLAGFVVAPQRARAGLLIRLSTSLGLSTNLVG